MSFLGKRAKKIVLDLLDDKDVKEKIDKYIKERVQEGAKAQLRILEKGGDVDKEPYRLRGQGFVDE